MKLKFIDDGRVDGEIKFEKGKIYDVTPQASADRWIRRGVAVSVPEGVKDPKKVETNPPAQKPEEKKPDQAPVAPVNKPLEQSPKPKQDVKVEQKKVEEKKPGKNESLDL